MSDRAAYQRAYYLETLALTGRAPRRPAEPITQHIRDLVAAGMTHAAIADASGVHPNTIAQLARAGQTSVRSRTANAILAVRPPVTLIGLTRRVRALAALGWSTRKIAAVAGLNLDTIKEYRRGDKTFTGSAAAGILRAWAALSMTPPNPTTRHEQAAVTAVRASAARNGWAPPLAWDDIDDPDATPDTGQVVRGGVDLDEWARLVRYGENPEQAAARCGITLGGIERAAYRHGRADILQLMAGAA